MYKITIGKHLVGIPSALDGKIVRLLRWVGTHGRCITDEGLVYNVPRYCLDPVEDVIVILDPVTDVYTIDDKVADVPDNPIATVLSKWGLNGEEESDQLEALHRKNDLADLLEDLYPLPWKMKVKRRDSKRTLAVKVAAAIKYRMGL